MHGGALVGAALAAALLLAPVPVAAHGPGGHERLSGAGPGAARAGGGDDPLPFEITLRFALIDQRGRAVSEADFRGRPAVLFFGYAHCPGMCPQALADIGAALDLLGPEGAVVVPVLVTVDPARDRPAALAAALAKYHPRFVGLTGSPEALAAMRAAFGLGPPRVVAETPDGPVFAHGGFVYLVDRAGRVVSLLPPTLGPARLAEVMRARLLEAPAS